MQSIQEIHDFSFRYLNILHEKLIDHNKISKIDITTFRPINDLEQARESDFYFRQDILDDLLFDFHISLQRKRIDEIKNGLEKIENLIESLYPEDFLDDLDKAKETIDVLRTEEDEFIYEFKPSIIEIPQLINSVGNAIFNMISKKPNLLYEITPRHFEEIIAEIFYRKGFDVELTKTTRDGGKDIIAFSNHMGIPLKYIIECKRYARHRKVSLEVIHRLFGVKIANSANKGILVTTSNYTKDAMVFANNHLWDLELKDYNDILFWLKWCQI